MPQMSIPYAVGRIRVLQRDMLDKTRLERLLSAASFTEAQKALSEIGWANVEGTDYEQASLKHVEKACKLVRAITPEPGITDCFLLRYDIHNLKTLLKSRALGEKAAYLSECGTLPVSLLAHVVAEHSYKKLPPVLREAMEALEKHLAVQPDAMEIDIRLDHAMYRMVFQELQNEKAPLVLQYFKARVDILNAVMLLRAKAMGRDGTFLKLVLIAGGTHSMETWQNTAQNTEKLPRLLGAYGHSVVSAAQDALLDSGKLPALEKAMDDALLSLFTPYRMAPLSLEPIIGYLLAAEREAAAVRLILAGKANGFSPEAIRERMRELYGR